MDASRGAIFDRNSVSVTYIDDSQARATAETREILLKWFQTLERDENGFNNKLIAQRGGLEPNSCFLSVKLQHEMAGLKIQTVLRNAGILCKELPPSDDEFVSHLLQNRDTVYVIGGRSYKIQQLLSDRGAWGDVFMAIDQKTQQKVVIKILRDSTDREHYAFQMFREAGSHPNIVQYIGDGLIYGRNSIVMEYISGQTLGQYLSNNVWTEELEKQHESALNFISGTGITLVRENERENVLITYIDGKPTVKLIDFGTLAKK